MTIKPTARRLAKTTAFGECLYYILTNAKRVLRPPVLDTTIHREDFSGEANRLVRHVSQLLPHAGIAVKDNCLAGKRVMVVGAGSTFGLSLLFYALGAETVVNIDPFIRNTGVDVEIEFTKYLLGLIPWPGARQRAASYVNANHRRREGVSFLVDGHHIKFYRAALGHPESLPTSECGFDLIISNAVFEHVQNLDAAFAQLKALLAPGGGMAHEFGFMNHGLFARFHPQKYLEFRPALWWLMTHAGAPPTRHSLSHFRRALAKASLNAELAVVKTYSPEETNWAMSHAHPAVRADTTEEMSAWIVILRIRPESVSGALPPDPQDTPDNGAPRRLGSMEMVCRGPQCG